MTNSNEKQNKQVVTTQVKGGKDMAVAVKVKENKPRKLNVVYQQDILEMFRYIYQNFPQKHTYYSLAHEMSKSTRTIQRMIDDLNNVCPCVTATMDEITGCAYLKVDYDNTNENEFDETFGSSNSAPLLYIFFKSFFIRKMSITEIMNDVVVLTKRETCKHPEKLKKAKKKVAGEIIIGIFDSTPLIDYDDEDGELIIGNVSFLSYEYDYNFFNLI